MRIAWLLLLFPLGVSAGCPTGLRLSNLPISTSLPYCVKWESSSLGGCYVACPGVCIETPATGTMGPIESTGNECSVGGGSDGDGGSEGGGENGGNNGGTGNPNLPANSIRVGGDKQEMTTEALRHVNNTLVSGFTSLMSNTAGSSRSAQNINTKMDDVIHYMKANNNGLSGMESSIREQTALELKFYNEFLGLKNAIINPQEGFGQSTSEYRALKELHTDMFGPDFAENNVGGNLYSLVGSYQYDVNSIKESTHLLNSRFDNFYYQVAYDLKNNSSTMNNNIKAIAEAIKSNGGAGGTGGGEGTGGTDIDYSKMPGAEGNPLSVKESKYSSSCQEKDCFFDVPAMQKKLDDTNKSLTDKYKDISGEVQKVFTFSLTGSADPMECLDLFSHQGKAYSVCPPTGAYWQTLAAIMMFVFYFIALMIIFKR